MPLFGVSGERLSPIEQTDLATEKVLQRLIEMNLKPVFSCRLVATEFSTGAEYGGRIDTLALSEDSNPVIIEYKKVVSSELINQSLFYLKWLHDHRGDFQVAVQKALGPTATVDWSDVRVICVAPNYRKYDLHAVQVMGAHIELWTYRLFKNDTIYLEEVLQKAYVPPVDYGTAKSPVMVEAGRKAAITRAAGRYTFDQHIKGKPANIRELAISTQDYVLRLDPAIEEAPKKYYVAYKTSQNILCMEIQRQRLVLFLKLDPKRFPGPPGISRDVSDIGHYGTGDLEITVRNAEDLEAAKPLISRAYEHVGA